MQIKIKNEPSAVMKLNCSALRGPAYVRAQPFTKRNTSSASRELEATVKLAANVQPTQPAPSHSRLWVILCCRSIFATCFPDQGQYSPNVLVRKEWFRTSITRNASLRSRLTTLAHETGRSPFVMLPWVWPAVVPAIAFVMTRLTSTTLLPEDAPLELVQFVASGLRVSRIRCAVL